MATNERSAPRSDDTADRHPYKPVVLFGSAAFIVVISAWALVTPVGASATIGAVVGWVSDWFGWYYFFVATLFLVFVLFMAASKYGSIKLGPEHSIPDFGLFGWGSMFFAAGIGIDLIFFSVAGPMAHYLSPPAGEPPPETVEAARQAIVWTLFHYGITGWAMYALMGMVLAYFAFRRGLPLAVRSALYPIIGKRIHGRIGDTVDLAAVVGAVFGIAVSLGIGVLQLNFGLRFYFGLPEAVSVQIALILIAVTVATISAVTGIDKGIQRLSQFNVILALILMAYVTVTSNPLFILNGLVMNIGDYISRFPGMTLNTFAYEQPTEWLDAWTLFFWAWWIAWAPFVGLFLARISRGRTIREFVVATLIVPFTFTLLFLSVFGNAALRVVREGGADFGETAANVPEQGFFLLLEQFPGVTFTAGLTIIVGLLLFVTSADSGALVIANLSSKLPTPLTDAKPWMRILWAIVIGLLTLAMLVVGGFDALQQATIIMGLPFSFVMLVVMWGLYKAVRGEWFMVEAARTSLPMRLSGRTPTEQSTAQPTWQQRLGRSLVYADRAAAERFMDEVCRPAFDEVVSELQAHAKGASVSEDVDEALDIPHLTLHVPMEDDDDFLYQVFPREATMPSHATDTDHDERYVRYEVHLPTGSQEYDVMGYDRDQLLADIVDQFERHLESLRLQREDSAGP